MTHKFIATAASLAAAIILTGCGKEPPQTPQQEQSDVHFTPEMKAAQASANSFIKLNILNMAKQIDLQRAKLGDKSKIDCSLQRGLSNYGVGFTYSYDSVEACATRAVTDHEIDGSSSTVTASNNNGRPIFLAACNYDRACKPGA